MSRGDEEPTPPLDMKTSSAPSPQNPEARRRALAANFQRANSFTLATAEAKSRGREFTATFTVPPRLPWTNLILRASATLSGKTGLGVMTLRATPLERRDSSR